MEILEGQLEKKAEPFFRMNFAQCLTVGSVILTLLWTVFGYGRDISDNSKEITKVSVEANKSITQVSADLKAEHDATQRQIDSLNVRVERIDREGTQYGKGQLNTRTNEQEATVRRVEKVEDSLNKLVPTVTQMSTNLEWISGWVKVQSQQPADRLTHK